MPTAGAHRKGQTRCAQTRTARVWEEDGRKEKGKEKVRTRTVRVREGDVTRRRGRRRRRKRIGVREG